MQTRVVGTGTAHIMAGTNYWSSDPSCHQSIDKCKTIQCPVEAGVLVHHSFGYRHIEYADVIATHRRA